MAEEGQIEALAEKIEQEAQTLFDENAKPIEEKAAEQVKPKKPKPKWEEFKKTPPAMLFGGAINSLIAKYAKMEATEVNETEFGQALLYTIWWYAIDFIPSGEALDPNSPLIPLGNATLKLGSKIVVKKVMQK